MVQMHCAIQQALSRHPLPLQATPDMNLDIAMFAAMATL